MVLFFFFFNLIFIFFEHIIVRLKKIRLEKENKEKEDNHQDLTDGLTIIFSNSIDLFDRKYYW